MISVGGTDRCAFVWRIIGATAGGTCAVVFFFAVGMGCLVTFGMMCINVFIVVSCCFLLFLVVSCFLGHCRGWWQWQQHESHEKKEQIDQCRR